MDGFLFLLIVFFSDTFWHNPQYRITLTDVDEGDDEEKCTVIVALMQKNRRSQRNIGMDCLTIGFAIYHVCCSVFDPVETDVDSMNNL